MRSEDRPTYASAVWETFRERFQPGRLTMSTAEFAMVIRPWMDQDVPLAVVLEGLANVEGKPRTLHACQRAVDAEIKRWARSYSV